MFVWAEPLEWEGEPEKKPIVELKIDFKNFLTEKHVPGNKVANRFVDFYGPLFFGQTDPHHGCDDKRSIRPGVFGVVRYEVYFDCRITVASEAGRVQGDLGLAGRREQVR